MEQLKRIVQKNVLVLPKMNCALKCNYGFSTRAAVLMISKCFGLREMCPYSELFWSAFSSIRTAYGEIFRISPYSVRMRENTGQNNSEYGHFLGSIGKVIFI